jgi:hypothetical protein
MTLKAGKTAAAHSAPADVSTIRLACRWTRAWPPSLIQISVQMGEFVRHFGLAHHLDPFLRQFGRYPDAAVARLQPNPFVGGHDDKGVRAMFGNDNRLGSRLIAQGAKALLELAGGNSGDRHRKDLKFGQCGL